MEIFTFMRMGGAMERIELKLIAKQDHQPGSPQRPTLAAQAAQKAARKQLTEQLAAFDAGKAECFKQEDRQRLLAVIEAGFGNFDDFNRGVREVFKLRRTLSTASGLQHASVTMENVTDEMQERAV